jgi:hypothetical protein
MHFCIVITSNPFLLNVVDELILTFYYLNNKSEILAKTVSNHSIYLSAKLVHMTFIHIFFMSSL